MANTTNTSSAGGVCNLNPQKISFNPTTAPLPAVPIATDLQSAIAAINALRQQMLNVLSLIPTTGVGGPNPFNVNFNIQNPGSGSGSGNNNNQNQQKNANFVEQTNLRVTKTVKVPIVDQGGNNVGTAEIALITGLTFKDKVTGQVLNYQQ